MSLSSFSGVSMTGSFCSHNLIFFRDSIILKKIEKGHKLWSKLEMRHRSSVCRRRTSQEVCLEGYRGKWLVLYFYPRDNTSGCTREAVDFTVALPELRELGAEVVGISRDSPASHGKFAEKHSLKVLLLSDRTIRSQKLMVPGH